MNTQPHVSFISQRDYQFKGEDPVLAAELKRRIESKPDHPKQKPVIQLPPLLRAPRGLRHDDMIANNGSSRRNLFVSNANTYKAGETSDADYYEMQMRVQLQALYGVQERMEHLKPTVNLYKNDTRFKLAYIFMKLNEWLRDLRIYTTYMRNRVNPNHNPPNFHLIYYSHCVARSADITYTVDVVLKLNEELQKKADEKVKDRADLG